MSDRCPVFIFTSGLPTDLIPDDEGSEHLDLASAREEAIDSAREIMSDRLLEGIRPDGSTFEITNENGTVIMTMPFGEAINAVASADSHDGIKRRSGGHELL